LKLFGLQAPSQTSSNISRLKVIIHLVFDPEISISSARIYHFRLSKGQPPLTSRDLRGNTSHHKPTTPPAIHLTQLLDFSSSQDGAQEI
jgi:hypothetical protein